MDISKLTECPACKNPVSAEAVKCPKCGHPLSGSVKKNKATMQLAGSALIFILGIWLSRNPDNSLPEGIATGAIVLGLIGFLVGLYRLGMLKE
jgi:predicted nucleic acid-binding Zn ribbon protein